MKKSEIKKGQIVVVMNGAAYGNEAETVTKVLSNENALIDGDIRLGIYPRDKVQNPSVLCTSVNGGKPLFTYRNMPAWYEYVKDLRPATPEEKKVYKKWHKEYVKKIINHGN